MATHAIKRLDELPEELVSNITVRLNVDDQCSLRLVCRALEHKSFHCFATEYYSHKAFMISSESLKVLVSIASSEKLRGYLHHIYILTALFSDRPPGAAHGCSCSAKSTAKQKATYDGFIRDQLTLKQKGKDKEMLIEAFSQLTSVKSLSIVDAPSSLSPEVDYRGRNKVRRLAGREPTLVPSPGKDKEYDDFQNHVWKILVESLGASKMSTITSFASTLTKGEHGLSIYPDLALATQPAMQTAFSNLENLMLRIHADVRMQKTSNSDKDKRARGMTSMKKLAATMPVLRMLDLTFDRHSSSGLYFTCFASKLDLAKLTAVFLEGLHITAKSLMTILSKLDSVEDLRLAVMDLQKGSWVTILKIIQSMSDHLKHLHLMYLLEAGQKAYFLKQREPPDELNGFDDHMDFDTDEEDESDGDTDDEMPKLEPVDAPATSTSDVTANSSAPVIAPGSADLSHSNSAPSPQTSANGPSVLYSDPLMTDPLSVNGHSSDNHTAPNVPDHGERGYYVCLKGDQIAAQIPTFIEEYNLGENVGDDMDNIAIPMGPGGPGNFNNFMSMLGAAFGVPPPPGGPNNGPGGPNANQPPDPNGGPVGGFGGFAMGTNGGIIGMGPMPIPSAGGAALPTLGPPPPPATGSQASDTQGSGNQASSNGAINNQLPLPSFTDLAIGRFDGDSEAEDEFD